MGLSYCAASYFIEAIYASQTYSISYDYVESLQSLVSREIASFLHSYDENDYLYIFKKFPDVFLLTENSVCLTAAFFTLYQLKNSLPGNQNARSDYLETSALLYFDNLLKLHGPQHFLHLFDRLTNDSTQQFAVEFRKYSTLDAFNFFKRHSDIFIFRNDIVYLNADTKVVMNPLLNEKICPETIKSFREAVYFLLTHFSSLHYLELKQCISYVLINAGEVFDQYPLIKQREWFENVPRTDMNELGFLSLKTSVDNLSLSDSLKMILLIVCLLAFEKKMHYQKIVNEVQEMFPPSMNSFGSMSLQQLLTFFHQYNQYFHISSDENVSLLPSFLFPGFPLGRPTFDSTPQNTSNELIPVVPFVTPENLNCDTNVPLPRSVNIDSQNGNCLITVITSNSCIMPNDVPAINTSSDLFGMLEFTDTTIKRVKISLSYLWKCFQKFSEYSMQNCYFNRRAVKTVILVLEDVYIPLCSWPKEDQCAFMAACSQFMDLELYKNEEYLSPQMLKEIEKEKELLIFTYCIKKKGTHFAGIALKMNGVDDSFPLFTTWIQFIAYFKKLPQFIRTDDKGVLHLIRLPKSLRSIMESNFPFPQQRKVSSGDKSVTMSNSLPDTNTRHFLPSIKNINMHEDVSNQTLDEKCVSEKISGVIAHSELKTAVPNVTPRNLNVDTNVPLVPSNVNFNNDSPQYDSSDIVYISRLIDSFLGNIRSACSASNISDSSVNHNF